MALVMGRRPGVVYVRICKLVIKKVTIRLSSLIDGISQVAGLVGGVLLAGMAGILVVEVVLRYGFNMSTLVADELSSYMLVALIFVASSYVLQRDRHIRIKVVTSRLKQRVQQRLLRIIAIINIPVLALLVWLAWDYTVEAYQLGEISQTMLHTPLYIPKMIMALGLSIFLLQAMVAIGRRVSPAGKPTKEPGKY